jgi:hypothetical protein
MLATATARPRNSMAHSIAKRTRAAAYAHRISTICDVSSEQPATISSLWSNKHFLLFWEFSFLMVAVDESFPLFCIYKSGILSASGVIYATVQYAVYSIWIQWGGLYGSMRIGALLGSPIVVFVPISLNLNRGQPDDDLSWSAFGFLNILMAMFRLFGLAFFSSIIVATNRAVSPSQ